MSSFGPEVPWLLLLVLLPIAAFGLAWCCPRRPFSTRDVPSDLYRMGTGIAFCWAVDPGLGLLSAASMGWWWLMGWPRISGGLLWPFCAMGVWLGLQAPEWAISLYVTALLLFGVAQTGIAVAQSVGAPIFRDGRNIHGTLGHRTGLGIYLALLTPLGFLTGAGPQLAALYGVGIVLSRSSVAVTAAVAGLLWVAPGLWGWVLPCFVAGLAYRMVKLDRTQPWGWKCRHLADSIFARRRIWTVTAQRAIRSWDQILQGAGHGAFQQQARTWVRSSDLATGEVYNEAHNDYLETFYEYGMVFVVVAAWWAYRYGGALGFGDPLTGALVALGVAALANFPTRVATLATVALMVAVMVARRVA